MFLAVTEDEFVLRNLERIGQVVSTKSLDALPQVEIAPAAVVIDLDVKDAVGLAEPVKARWGNALIAGFLSYPDRKLWQAAEAAGFHLVTTRGALAAQLHARLKNWKGSATLRVRICDVADLAGRLGVVMRLDDVSTHPVAVYHIGSEVFVAEDVCPHAGARLSEGELAGSIITCPRHGSQFNVRTGERVRGPADLGIKTYRIEREGGQVFVVKDEAPQ